MAEDDAPQTSAQAHAAAQRATSSIDLGAGGTSDEPEPDPAPTPDAADGGDDDDQGDPPADSTVEGDPDPEAGDEDEAPPTDADSTAVDGADTDDDDEDAELPEAVRKTVAGYKNPNAVAKALHETKTHSLKQHDRIRELEARLADSVVPPAAPAPKAAPADSIAEVPDAVRLAALRVPPELEGHRRAVATLPDAYDKADADLKACVDEISTLTTANTKAASKIEFLKEELETADEYRKDQIESQLAKLASDKDRADGRLSVLRLDERRLTLDRDDVYDTYHRAKSTLTDFEKRQQIAVEANRKVTEAFPEMEKAARVKVNAAIKKAADTLKIPTDLRQDFAGLLMEAANGHPGQIPEDLDAFFLEKGRRPAKFLRRGDAESANVYGDRKRVDAEAPAPEGRAAQAAPRKEQVLSSKEADRRARLASKRIPLA